MKVEDVLRQIVDQKIVSISTVEYEEDDGLLSDDGSGIMITLENGVILDTLGEPLGFTPAEEEE